MSSGRAVSAAFALLLASASASTAPRTTEPPCEVVTPLTALRHVREASGLAISRQQPRRLFTINDSGTAEVIVLNLDGALFGKVAITGATVVDWEDVTTGPCAGRTCLYVSDIGDNHGVRQNISVYRMLEPGDGDRQAAAVRFDAVYPDGPHDAEALFTGPGDRLYLLTKQARGAGLYAFPARLTPDMPNRLERIATIDAGRGRDRFARITDAETSLDGRTVAVRSNDTLFLVPVRGLLAGQLDKAIVFSLRQLQEPQGEGVALGTRGDVFLAGEGIGHRAAGTFARMRCVAASR